MRIRLAQQITAIWILALPVLTAQTFSSGSTGSDGALNLTTPGTIVFDPKSFSPALNPAGDNVFNFSTINIGPGVTVKLSSQKLSSPVFWLSQGPVTINGTIDLSGDDGYPFTTFAAGRFPSSPGAGGYGGGVGSLGISPAQPGSGPGGGAAPDANCGIGGGGSFTGNQFLVPLLGGSGGGGETVGGGAGAGALLIASSTSITVNGAIIAKGGSANISSGGEAGGGSGGAIRLAANSIGGSGATFSALGGGPSNSGRIPVPCRQTQGGSGVIRIEAFTSTLSANFQPSAVFGSPFGVFPPTGLSPTVQVVSVNGVPVPLNPSGSFSIPDVTINSSLAVPVVVQARNVPTGTSVKLQILSDNAPDQVVSATLTGTLALSTATASVVLPSGFSRGFVSASFISTGH